MRRAFALAAFAAFAALGCSGSPSAHNQGACTSCTVGCRLLATIDHPTRIVADDARIYFLAGESHVFSLVKSGGDPYDLGAAGLGRIPSPHLAQSSQYLFSDVSGIVRIDKQLGQPATLLPNQGPSFAVDDQGLYYEPQSNGPFPLLRLGLDGSGPDTIAETSEICGVVALDSTWIYCTSLHRLTATLRSGGTTVPIAGGIEPPVVLDGDWLYWVGASGPQRTPKAGGTSEPVGTAVAATVWQGYLAVDDAMVYWLETSATASGPSLALLATAKDRSSSRTLCSALHSVYGLAADAQSVYVSVDNTILSVDKQ